MKEIIINTNKEQIKTIMLVENGHLIEQYEQDYKYKNIEGNIYVGKVQNIFQGMQAAFVNIGEERNTFIHLKDIMPKMNTKTNSNIEENIKNSNIKDYVKTDDNILIQVKRSSYSSKGARVSTHISIPGKYIVFMPNTDIITVSQKIETEAEAKRLNEIAKKNLPKNCGAIIRTSANNKTEEEIKIDIEKLSNIWKDLNNKLKDKNTKTPILLYKSNDIIKTMLIDMIDKGVQRVTVNEESIYSAVTEMLEELDKISEIELIFKKDENLLSMYDLQEQLEKLHNRKIYLKCGGFITIDKTEALTAIDVNSGKYTGKKDLEQTVFTVNQEATLEIAKQIILRDIGGIIIIDYIDMKDDKNRNNIVNILEQALKEDRSKTQILGFTKLNLLEMTRKKIQG